MSEQRLCLAQLSEIGDPGSKGFSVHWRGEQLEGLVVRRDTGVFAYANHCPHTGAPLDWLPDQFLDSEGVYIQCAVHGAWFEIESGLCIYGPCIDQRLQPLPVELEGGSLYLTE